MTFDELKKACDDADASGVGWVIVNVPQRRRFHRNYRVCKGLSGNVIGSTRAGMLTISIKSTKVREFLRQIESGKQVSRC
jgi:hypothetical protein